MRLRLVLLVAALSLASCGKPEVTAFSVEPHALCEGDSAIVTWRVKGSAVLSAEPSLPGTGAVDESGALRTAPASDTHLTLTVTRRGKTAFARQEIVVLPSELDTFLVVATAPADSAHLAASVGVPPEHWDSSVLITSVSNPTDRMIDVRHDGRSASLASGASTASFSGSSYGGEWSLEAPLLPGERMGDPQHAPPEFLRLDVHLKCTD